MKSELQSIEIGHRGKVKMLQACFGSGQKTGDTPTTKPTAEEFRSFAQTHNVVINKK